MLKTAVFKESVATQTMVDTTVSTILNSHAIKEKSYFNVNNLTNTITKDDCNMNDKRISNPFRWNITPHTVMEIYI